MTVKRRVVKRSTPKKTIVVRRKSSSSKKFVPPKLPDKPSVTKGGKCYGRSKKGWFIVARFYITQHWGKSMLQRVEPSDPWYVVDCGSGGLADGTDATGYPKERAIKIAKWFRDNHDAWTRLPF